MHLIRPTLTGILRYTFEIAENMGITDRMLARIPEVGRPAVMDHDPFERGKYTDRIHRLRSSFRMMTIQREEIRTGCMQPFSFAVHPESGFISMQNRCSLQKAFHLFFKTVKVCCTG